MGCSASYRFPSYHDDVQGGGDDENNDDVENDDVDGDDDDENDVVDGGDDSYDDDDDDVDNYDDGDFVDVMNKTCWAARCKNGNSRFCSLLPSPTPSGAIYLSG